MQDYEKLGSFYLGQSYDLEQGERIRKLRETVELTISTPGSSAGVPISVLQSFKAPHIRDAQGRLVPAWL